MFDFLTPERFNMLILATMCVGMALAAWRFYVDMTRDLEPHERREQAFDEFSQRLQDAGAATEPTRAIDADDTTATNENTGASNRRRPAPDDAG